MTKSNHRESEYPVDPMFLDRWSPRAFTGEIIEEAQLLGLLDAAHCAPSSANHQPWRFIYGLKGSESWEKFVALLNDSNQEWARNASALIFVVSRAFTGAAGSAEEKPSYTHSFDAGAAWGHLAIQARLSGFYAHGMGGIKHEEISQAFSIPEGYRVEAGVALSLPSGWKVSQPLNILEEPMERKG
ncbi:nitroreductase family protein, partial [Rhizobium ruizarguesonis]